MCCTMLGYCNDRACVYIRAVNARAQRSPLSVGTCSRFSGRDIFETICMTTDNNIHSENFYS